MKHSLAWEIEQSEKIADCKVFTVHRDSASIVRDGKRRTHDFFYLNSSDWVNVIPITQEGDVILIEQYRAGVASITLEIPGGTVDAEDLSSKEAGARELLEETGYAADELVFIGRTHPNPAIQNNACDTYIAVNARKTQEPQFDGSEEITIKKVPLSSVSELIRGSVISHALVIVAFHYLHLYQTRSTK